MQKRPTVALISRDALKHNYREIRKRLNGETSIMAVIKANAYGHGDVEAARVFAKEGCGYFGVALPEEGVRLREAGVGQRIVVLGGIFPEQSEEIIEWDLTPVLFDLKTAKALNEAAEKKGVRILVHVKIDTGMGRLGIVPSDVESFFDALRGFTNLELEGVLSHFSDADSNDRGFTDFQMSSFRECLDAVKAKGFNPGLIHMGNSAATIEVKEAHFNMVRPGIMLYGSYPAERFASKIDLRPALEFKTRVLLVKRLNPGDSVSYGRSFVARRKTDIAVLPAGYADGVPRALSGKGSVLIRGKRAPIAGVVCMDLTMCDVTGIEGVAEGDEAVIIGEQGNERITAEEIARLTGTISYEILSAVSARVPRIYA